jgi:WD40 repeat protein
LIIAGKLPLRLFDPYSAGNIDRILLASCSHDETIRLWDTDFWICTKVLCPQRIYEGMNITKVTGITPSQIDALKSLGAIAELPL